MPSLDRRGLEFNQNGNFDMAHTYYCERQK